MSLRHILLGMLSKPQSGYDLRKHFDKSLRNFWRAELSQIYPLLRAMEQEGLLTSSKRQSEKGPPKRVYQSTPEGRMQLVSWLTDGPIVGDERIGYLAQVYFLANLKDDDKVVTFIRKLRAYMAGQLEHLEDIEAGWRKADPDYPDALADEDFYAQLTLAMGIKKYQASVAWCDESIARIEARKTANGKARQRAGA